MNSTFEPPSDGAKTVVKQAEHEHKEIYDFHCRSGFSGGHYLPEVFQSGDFRNHF